MSQTPRPKKIAWTEEDWKSFSKLDTSAKIELLLSSSIGEILVGIDQAEWSDETLHRVTSNDFLPLVTSYSDFALQKKITDQTTRLTKQNNRLQFFLTIFAGISAAGVIVQALAAAHFFGLG